MSIASTMNLNTEEDNIAINTHNTTTTNSDDNNNKEHPREDAPVIDTNGEDGHEHDMVMPGFRFHPTEDELVEFYLRRKVEGKRFNVDLITFLDLYRYDPWELPAMAVIGEKEWYFYVPRDRKYRNGDRPNRVTTTGYWKATGADRMIRGENSIPIGLKKTLVFYCGKAPKGIRTSWIMNEYRLPQHETHHRYHKGEISLCRVYKRPGVEDHPSVPRGIPSRLSSSSRATSSSSLMHRHHHHHMEKLCETDASSSTEVGVAMGRLSGHHSSYTVVSPMAAPTQQSTLPPSPPPIEVDRMIHILTNHDQTINDNHHQQQQQQGGARAGRSSVIPIIPSSSLFMGNSSSSSSPHDTHHHENPSMEEIHRLVEYQQSCLINHHLQQQQQQLLFQPLNTNNNNQGNTLSSNTTTAATNSMFLFPNYLFSPSPAQLVVNPIEVGPATSTLQLPPTTTSGGGSSGGVAFSDRLWEWNPFPEPNNRDHFNNPFK